MAIVLVLVAACESESEGGTGIVPTPIDDVADVGADSTDVLVPDATDEADIPDVAAGPDLTEEPDVAVELDVPALPELPEPADIADDVDILDSGESDVTSPDVAPTDANDDGVAPPLDIEDPDAVGLEITEPDADGGDVTTEEVVEEDVTIEDVANDDVTMDDTVEDDVAALEPDIYVPPPDCDPTLTLAPEAITVLPYELVTFSAAGGSARRFTLLTNMSGGLVNQLTGAYLSGGTAGSADVVEVTSLGCVGSATALVKVVTPPHVLPGSATVPPGTTIAFEVDGGSGSVSWSLGPNAAGATIGDDGAFVAGAGNVTVIATDVELGLALPVNVTVKAGGLVADPGHIALPVGATYVPKVYGGSGTFDYSRLSNDPTVSVNGGIISGDLPGTAVVLAEDRYADLTIEIPVTVVVPEFPTLPRTGDSSAHSMVVSPGDIDGDGFADAILGVRETDFQALDGGAVFIYRGQAGGLDPTPVRVFAGNRRRDFLGQTVRVADMDGDGQDDLLISGYQLDAGLTDNGAIRVYRGVPGKFYEAEPYHTFAGPFASDEFGFWFDVCDVNGDGRSDLVASARLGEDRKSTPQATNQGALHVYLGRDIGFQEVPDALAYGSTLQANGIAYENDLQLGFQLTCGDFDGDGADDVAIESLKWGSAAGRSNDGFIALYQGIVAGESTVGGLETTPYRLLGGVAASDAGTNLGRSLAAGDLDGDGIDELIASQYLHGITGKIQVGAVRIWRGGDAIAAGTVATATDGAESATWSIEGTVASDQTGWWVEVGDADGVSPIDLVVGDFQLEVPGGAANTGAVRVFAGVQDGPPSPTPLRFVAYGATNDRFGQSAAILPDLDGDGTTDLFVFSGRNDELGANVGRAFYVRGGPVEGESGPLPAVVPLDLPGVGAGSNVGRGAAIVPDLDGDGYSDLVYGAPNAELDQNQNAGFVFIHRGTASGFAAEPSTTLKGFTGHSDSDQFGWAVSTAGDFDGDGNDDLAVLARSDDRPSNVATNAAYIRDGTCTGATTNTGAVFVFRGRSDSTFETKPAFVFFPPQDSSTPDSLDGGFDVDGDGYDDLVVGAVAWDPAGATNGGAALVIRGRALLAADKIGVICDPHVLVPGLAANDALGRSVAGVPDLDGDGCDEVAIGANAEDLGQSNQGTVRILWGYGAGCDRQDARVSVFAPGIANAQAGFSIDAGPDVDGDGVPDLVTGAFNLTVGGNAVGAAWLLRGSWIAGQAAAAVPLATTPPPTVPFTAVGTTLPLRVDGATLNEQFGRSVALVPNAYSDGRAGVLVGSPLSASTGTALAGGARMYRFDGDGTGATDGLRATATWAFGGETGRTEGRLGEWVAAGVLAGLPYAIITGYEGQGAGLDQGSVYVVPTPLPIPGGDL
ncbi:MAG: FG-GAP repeat protein [Myxococcales bacterium]|nr:FG-GAP repeat protein [Myxococcales bacterium]